MNIQVMMIVKADKAVYADQTALASAVVDTLAGLPGVDGVDLLAARPFTPPPRIARLSSRGTTPGAPSRK